MNLEKLADMNVNPEDPSQTFPMDGWCKFIIDFAPLLQTMTLDNFMDTKLRIATNGDVSYEDRSGSYQGIYGYDCQPTRFGYHDFSAEEVAAFNTESGLSATSVRHIAQLAYGVFNSTEVAAIMGMYVIDNEAYIDWDESNIMQMFESPLPMSAIEIGYRYEGSEFYDPDRPAYVFTLLATGSMASVTPVTDNVPIPAPQSDDSGGDDGGTQS